MVGLRDLEWDVAVFLGRVPVALSPQCIEGVDETRSRIARIDDVVEVAAASRYVRMSELRPVLFNLLVRRLRGVRALCDFLAKENVHRAFRSHHSDLGRGPGNVEVATNVLGAHDVIRSAVRLSRYDRQFGNRRFAVGVKELRAVLYDSTVLLSNTGKESGNILERHHGNVERVAEADESRCLHRCVYVEH